jgi:hypothetical protein
MPGEFQDVEWFIESRGYRSERERVVSRVCPLRYLTVFQFGAFGVDVQRKWDLR